MALSGDGRCDLEAQYGCNERERRPALRTPRTRWGYTNTWQTVTTPLDAIPAAAGFSLAKVKVVCSTQGEADDPPHTLWFDNLRFRTGSGRIERLVLPLPRPEQWFAGGHFRASVGRYRLTARPRPLCSRVLCHGHASPAGLITVGATTVTWEDGGPPATDLPPAGAPARFYRVFRLETP